MTHFSSAGFAFRDLRAARALALLAGLAVMLLVPAGGVKADDDEELELLRSTSISAYRLGPNDRVRITVFGETDLSGEFDVDPSGFVSLPLIGEVEAANLTPRQLERSIEEKYADGYLVSPRVNLEVSTYRPFFIIGEVNNAGQYPFESGMSIVKAVTTAGGYTYRANKDKVYLTRREIREEEFEVPTDAGIYVLPGDVIRVPERFF